jgi:hypothetical protein
MEDRRRRQSIKKNLRCPIRNEKLPIRDIARIQCLKFPLGRSSRPLRCPVQTERKLEYPDGGLDSLYFRHEGQFNPRRHPAFGRHIPFEEISRLMPRPSPGEIWVLDATENYETAELTRDNFNTRFKLCYGT